MGKGSNTTTSTTVSQPPQQILDAYTNLVNQATNVASTPYQQYTGNLVAGFTPQQLQAFQGVSDAQDIANPYINAAAQDYGKATQGIYSQTGGLSTGQTQGIGKNAYDLSNQAAGVSPAQAASGNINAGVNAANNSGITAAASPFLTQGVNAANNSGITAAASPYLSAATSAAAQNPNGVNAYMSPYINNVVQATQAQQQQNDAIQQQQLKGTAISQGALGGDRAGVAQAVLAGQQDLANNQTIANLYNQGYQQAQTAQQNAQQLAAGTNLGAANTASGAAAQQAGLQTNANLAAGSTLGNLAGSQASLASNANLSAGSLLGGLTNSQAQNQLSAAGLQSGLYGNTLNSQLGAATSQGWLNSQAAQGMAGLGSLAQGTALTGANALLNAGSLQQQQAQNQLTTGYQQWQQQQQYPFQTTGWLANIAEGLGNSSGGTSSTTTPNGSSSSGILGSGLLGAGLGSSLAGTLGLSGGLASGLGGLLGVGLSFLKHGGAVKRAYGGGLPDLSISYVPELSGISSVHSSIPQAPAAPSASASQSQSLNPGIISELMKLVGGDAGGAGIGSALADPTNLASMAALAGVKRGGGIHSYDNGGSIPMLSETSPMVVGSSPGGNGVGIPILGTGHSASQVDVNPVSNFAISPVTPSKTTPSTSQSASLVVPTSLNSGIMGASLPAGVGIGAIGGGGQNHYAGGQDRPVFYANGGGLPRFDDGGDPESDDDDVERQATISNIVRMLNQGNDQVQQQLPTQAAAPSIMNASAQPPASVQQTTPQQSQGHGFFDTMGGDTNWGLMAALAGAGILSGRSPNALQNIGTGVLQGLQGYQGIHSQQVQEQQQKIAQDRLAQQAQAEADYRNATLKQAADKLSADIQMHRDTLALDTKKAADEAERIHATTQYNQGMLGVAQRNADAVRATPFIAQDANGNPVYLSHDATTGHYLDASGNPLTPEQMAGLKNLNKAGGNTKPDVSADALQNRAQMIANYELAPPTGYELGRNPQSQELMAQVVKLNPQYNAQNFTSSQKAYNAFMSGKEGTTTRNLNNSIAHLSTLGTLADALDNGDVNLLNSVKQKFQQQFGETAPTNFDAAKQIVGNEVVKAITGTGGGVTDRQEAAEAISRARSPAQLKGVINTYQQLLGGQLQGLGHQYQVSTMRNDFDKLLTDETKHALNWGQPTATDAASVDQQQLINFARDAIAQKAPRDAVLKRLKDQGISNPEALLGGP